MSSLIEENFENEDDDYKNFLRNLSKCIIIKDTKQEINEESEKETLQKIISGEIFDNRK